MGGLGFQAAYGKRLRPHRIVRVWRRAALQTFHIGLGRRGFSNKLCVQGLIGKGHQVCAVRARTVTWAVRARVACLRKSDANESEPEAAQRAIEEQQTHSFQKWPWAMHVLAIPRSSPFSASNRRPGHQVMQTCNQLFRISDLIEFLLMTVDRKGGSASEAGKGSFVWCFAGCEHARTRLSSSFFKTCSSVRGTTGGAPAP